MTDRYANVIYGLRILTLFSSTLLLCAWWHFFLRISGVISLQVDRLAFFFFRYSAGYDLAARRKNATRESTATLKAWLNEHKKNPYPTKGEKIMLAIITKMTLTQVSTWFANARRRLKKENKMTWEPKNKTDDDDDAVLSDSEDNKEKDDLAADNRGDRVGEEARRGLDDTGKSFFPSLFARYHTRCPLESRKKKPWKKIPVKFHDNSQIYFSRYKIKSLRISPFP